MWFSCALLLENPWPTELSKSGNVEEGQDSSENLSVRNCGWDFAILLLKLVGLAQLTYVKLLNIHVSRSQKHSSPSWFPQAKQWRGPKWLFHQPVHHQGREFPKGKTNSSLQKNGKMNPRLTHYWYFLHKHRVCNKKKKEGQAQLSSETSVSINLWVDLSSNSNDFFFKYSAGIGNLLNGNVWLH